MTEVFLDTNVLVYLFSGDAQKADRAEQLLSSRPLISIQVMNELTNVCRRKIRLSWDKTHEVLRTMRRLCDIEPLTMDIHETGLYLGERYQLRVYDAMIVAAALEADCKILFSEDMQHGLVIEQKLTIHNPFSKVA